MGLLKKIDDPYNPFKANEHLLPTYDPANHDEWVDYWKVRRECEDRQNKQYLAEHRRDGRRVGAILGAGMAAVAILVSQITPSTASGSESDGVVCEGKSELDAIPGTVGSLKKVVRWEIEGVTDENLGTVVKLVADANRLKPDDTLEDSRDFPLTLPEFCYQPDEPGTG